LESLFEEPLACDLALWPDLKKLVERAEAELCDEAHPHSKIANQKNKSASYETSYEKRGPGRPPTHGLSRAAIYRSYREAKRRCTDPKCPDYARYGGRGIEFRFDSVTDVWNAIGDRPLNTSLDRIDPNGHYEVGNVRWSSPKEQANNRSRSSGQDRYQPMGWAQGAREAYLQTAKHWTLSVKGLSDPTSLSDEENGFVIERHAETGLPHSTLVEEFKFHESQGPYRQMITLPSVNRPGGRVAFRCGNSRQISNSPNAGRGLLEALIDVPLNVNCSQEEILALRRFIRDFKDRKAPPGLRFLNGSSEKTLMAMACWLVKCRYNVRVILCAEIADRLSQDTIDPLLKDQSLFIPDLQVWPAVFGGEKKLNEQLFSFLHKRRDLGLQTVVYLEDPNEWGGPETPWGILFSWWFRPSDFTVAQSGRGGVVGCVS
jgi:hypothetical protein